MPPGLRIVSCPVRQHGTGAAPGTALNTGRRHPHRARHHTLDTAAGAAPAGAALPLALALLARL